MSASQQKKNRVELRSEGNDKKLNAAAEQAQKNRKFKRNSIIAAVIVVIVIAGALVINSNLFYTKSTAVQIGNTKYSAAEVNCYYEMAYNSVYNQYYQTYGEYVSYFLDPQKPLSEQQYSEEQTWADYIYDVALDNMRQTTVLYDEAMKNGYQLTAEDQATVDQAISSMEIYATNYGYENINAFLAANYGGKGMNEQLYRDVMTRLTIAGSYAEKVQNDFTYTDDQLKAYYAENADSFDVYSYELFYVGTGDEAFADLDDDAKADAAHAAAEEIAAQGKDVETFNAAVHAYAGEDHTPTVTNTDGLSISETFSGWLCDSARTAGDTTVIDTDTGSYALLFVGRDDNNYPLVNMRHILVKAEADEEGNYTDEALDAAKASAEDIYAQWQADPTEDNFAALATQYSEDEGSAANGGLYENIYRHYMVDEIDEFLFDSDAQVGDTTLVYGNNGTYAGYHVVYFAGEGQLFCDKLADSTLRAEDYSAYYDALVAGYAESEGFGMKFTDLK